MNAGLAMAIITERDQALEVLNGYLASRDNSEIAPYVRGMTQYEDEQTFAIMQGSGNEMGLFEQFVSLVRDRGLISGSEALQLLSDFADSVPAVRR